MATRNRCACGRVMSRYATRCNKCHAAYIARLQAEAQTVVATGCCPQCGASLRRNSALTGWWQCAQYGAEGFRVDSSRPACSFQTFTA
jgi:hypothetical protein